jgi:hypothetical protein
VIDPDLTAADQPPLTHPDWCDRFRCTAETLDGIHIGEPTLVPLADHPGDGALVQRFQPVATLAEPNPPVRIGIRWRGTYRRLPPMTIPLDRAIFFGEVLCRTARLG